MPNRQSRSRPETTPSNIVCSGGMCRNLNKNVSQFRSSQWLDLLENTEEEDSIVIARKLPGHCGLMNCERDIPPPLVIAMENMCL